MEKGVLGTRIISVTLFVAAIFAGLAFSFSGGVLAGITGGLATFAFGLFIFFLKYLKKEVGI